MRIVVIGGTGMIGSEVVDKLAEHGHDAVAASPRTGVDTLTRRGLAEALDGAQAVVDASNPPSLHDAATLEFFTRSTGNLLSAEAAARVSHHVTLSPVGTERLAESGYFRAKMAQENLIRQSPIPFSVVHSTQFYEFVGTIARAATEGSGVRLAPVLIQPVAAEDAAEAVAQVAAGAPLNGLIEVAGPEQFRLDDLIRRRLRQSKDSRRVLTDPHARFFGAALDERTLLPGEAATILPLRFQSWLGQWSQSLVQWR
ncbi:SDR family oxidoreductase [Arthrobacter sp. MSA 4-2]|uniref:SDR family oxidoreductase n=1 Tax=Arthrobacter sp. MSA 4-2 TaxID=2794349 RepID=UPI0018E79048|nr:SDR family oxidoreductase [Arthrobacter sp. MSA 4-2]MBJ2121488.1 SDR family oxidoreductase [Arthrobacter sp. MSA 4-2]